MFEKWIININLKLINIILYYILSRQIKNKIICVSDTIMYEF